MIPLTFPCQSTFEFRWRVPSKHSNCAMLGCGMRGASLRILQSGWAVNFAKNHLPIWLQIGSSRNKSPKNINLYLYCIIGSLDITEYIYFPLTANYCCLKINTLQLCYCLEILEKILIIILKILQTILWRFSTYIVLLVLWIQPPRAIAWQLLTTADWASKNWNSSNV